MDIGLGSSATTLETRYAELDSPVLLTGIQAIVRVLLEQARLDRAAGRKTGGFVSGYRGSPLGGLDQELWRRAKLLDAHGIRFQPGLNEDLAVTMLSGTQQLDFYPGANVDGVFGLWYGKGPGVDRSADALRVANAFGSHRHGGVLAIAGDDHGAHSSTFPHQTDQLFEAVMMPVLQPADVAEIVEFGLAGLAMSRFSGLWVAMKTIAETAEQSATAVVPSLRNWVTPAIIPPPHGFNIDTTMKWPAERFVIEQRVVEERLPAARAWWRANGIDRVTQGSAEAPFGIVTVGKAHHDLLHALAEMGLSSHPGIAIFKVGMTWPLETEGLRDFARGRRALLVVEEKRSFVEAQIRAALYNLPSRPAVMGKTGLDDLPLLPAIMELSPDLVVRALCRVLPEFGIEAHAPDFPAALEREDGLLTRAPTFCAGCPHNTSTRLPDGSFAMAGIGCHVMAMANTPGTKLFSVMGGEGVAWSGLAPFTDLPHVFANMGDGTYQHSGLLAIRQAVVAKSRITYKILYNDAVAMTGGQPTEGAPTVIDIARQVWAEGVGKLLIVADDPDRLPDASALPPGIGRHGRDDMPRLQEECTAFEGVSVIIYDQVCATEKRRRRKRGTMAAAEVKVSINPRVCENCGDCTTQSHCIAIEPIETAFGRKRRISPTSCNTDLSCLKGFCPSFVTASTDAPKHDNAAEWQAREASLAAGLADPVLPDLATPWRGLFAGIGGGGIVTAGAIVAMAAHLEGKQVSTLDFTGLAQKNGAVVSHVQIAAEKDHGWTDVVRIPTGEADLMLAADLAVGAQAGVLERMRRGGTVVGNLDLQASTAFLTDRDLVIDAGLHRRVIDRAVGGNASVYLRATALSEKLFGQAQALNTLLMGLAWQAGLLPVGQEALLRSIELNGTAVALNRRAFTWGRILHARPDLAEAVMSGEDLPPATLPELIAAREAELVRYQGTRLARRYRRLVDKAAAREAAVFGQPGRFARAVAEGLFRAFAYKDEYEVARLHSLAEYGDNPVFHLAPPLLSRLDPATGRRKKIAIPGRIALPLFRALRHGKALRGTPFDPFGWQAERRAERQLARDTEASLTRAIDELRPHTLDTAIALAEIPQAVRGFGPVKEKSLQDAIPQRAALLAALSAPPIALAAE
jgi:indolepyruvate ferredoxin oxidoreductase